MWIDKTGRSPEESLELLSGLTARLASTARLDEIVETVLKEIVDLGFGAVWMAVLDETTGHLVTLKEVIDGVDTTHEMPPIFMLDMRQPIGHGFRERRMINVTHPESLHILEHDGEQVPDGRLALPRVIYDHMRGHPFACGPLLGSAGQPVGALGLSSYRGREPIPDEVFSQGLLRAFMAHLGIAMERALDLARLERINAELVAAQAAIERDARTKAVGELAAAVAHDLNNFANVALLAANLGARSPDDALDALPRIERAIRAIGELVARLQRVARHGVPNGEVHDLANLREIVEDIAAMIAPLLREQSISLELALDPVPAVRCESSLAHQLVLNLLMNAHDALVAEPGGVRTVRVQLRDDRGVVRLIVSDSGPGISPEILPHLFEPFVTTKSPGHAGLGLAASRVSLEHLGGRIEGRNDPSGGAVFEIVLPVAPEAPVAAPAPAPARAAASRRIRVLAIDDDPDIVYVVRAYLEPLGYEVVTATSADEGLAATRDHAFDIVLCDIGMPGRSGLEVCELLRGAGYRGKIVLMTGWDGHAVETDARARTCDIVLKKPFVGHDLRQALESLAGS